MRRTAVTQNDVLATVDESATNRTSKTRKRPRNYPTERKLLRYSFTLFENG